MSSSSDSGKRIFDRTRDFRNDDCLRLINTSLLAGSFERSRESCNRELNMCGITGFWSKRRSPSPLAILRGMAGSIAHRGPDDNGVWFDELNGIGFGHRRLSIVDLSIE